MDILCKRCGMGIPTFNKLRKWCVNCRHDLTNERARLRNKAKTMAKRTLRENSRRG